VKKKHAVKKNKKKQKKTGCEKTDKKPVKKVRSVATSLGRVTSSDA
jgi:hypothetical protein